MRLLPLFLIFIITTTSAASVISTISAQGDGSVARNFKADWDSGTSSDHISGASGSILLTAPGVIQYQTKDNLDATVNNRYNATGYTRFDNGGVFSDSLSMDAPDQDATVTHTGILQTAEIDTAKYVSDANMSIGQQASWDGVGLYTRDAEYHVETQVEKGKEVLHYRSGSNDHVIFSTKATGGMRVRPEFAFTDFSDVFISNTSANETANETVEEA